MSRASLVWPALDKPAVPRRDARRARCTRARHMAACELSGGRCAADMSSSALQLTR